MAVLLGYFISISETELRSFVYTALNNLETFDFDKYEAQYRESLNDETAQVYAGYMSSFSDHTKILRMLTNDVKKKKIGYTRLEQIALQHQNVH